MQPLMLIGYFPKKVAQRPEWLKAARVEAIRSVSECISAGPKDWIQHWTHNELWVYSTISATRAVVPEAERRNYQIQAYRMMPMEWDEEKGSLIALPPLNIEPLPECFTSVGFDVVSREKDVAGFGCSPLSCNHMAEEIVVNKHCLLNDLESAKRVALEFSRGSVEPGPYCIIEVLI